MYNLHSTRGQGGEGGRAAAAVAGGGGGTRPAGQRTCDLVGGAQPERQLIQRSARVCAIQKAAQLLQALLQHSDAERDRLLSPGSPGDCAERRESPTDLLLRDGCLVCKNQT